MKYDMVSLGPARMDVFATMPDEDIPEVCSIDRKRCMVELGFGDKIPVKTMEFAVGGNTGNNAAGLARLGYKTAMLGTMGDHWIDLQAMELLRQENVNIDNIKKIPGAFGFGIVINYHAERTILSYYPDADGEFWMNDPEMTTDWVYLTTAGKSYEAFYEQGVAWAKKIGAKIGFNPGSRQVKDGIEKNRFAYEATEVLFVNKEEAARLLNVNPNESKVKDLLSNLKAVGPKIVVITDGPEGAYCFDGQKYLYLPIIAEAPVVERTGVGDAFGSGFLAAYIKGKAIEECLVWGSCNSSSVVGYVGPQRGMLTPETMNEWLIKAEKYPIQEI